MSVKKIDVIRVEAAGLALRLGADEGLAQVQEPGCPGGEARGGRGLGQKAVMRGSSTCGGISVRTDRLNGTS